MVRILLLTVTVGLAASCNGTREFVFNVGVLKTLLTTEADLIDRILDEILQQQQELKAISNAEAVYSKELEDVLHKANEYSLSAKRTFSMLTDVENLWPKIDAHVKETRNKMDLHNVTSSKIGYQPEYVYDDHEYGIFENSALKLCNGMIPLSPKIEKNLQCRFVDHRNPFLKIAPFKQEDVYLDPFIVIYHNVLSDAEIEMLQEDAYPALESSRVIINKGLQSSNARISENAWLLEEVYPKVKSINERAGDMTNLNIDTSEPLQIAYYKPGGYFNEHHDFYEDQDNEIQTFSFGNRMGTLMFYLNDVQEGGRTIFTDLNVSLTPKKGNAVFWYNISPNGRLDYFTMHAGCRVVSGVKWVANKWFHEHGQEFRRPCLLENVYDVNRNGL